MKSTSLLLASASALGLASVAYAQPVPILEYKFDNAATTSAPSTGSTATAAASLSFFGSNNSTPANIRGGAGSGVSGQATDLAVNFSSAGGMGNTTNSVVARHGADLDVIDGFRSFTLQGWFRTDTTTQIGGGARIFVNIANNQGFQLLAPANGTLRLEIGNTTSTATQFNSNAAYTATQSWVFFAVTYTAGAQSSVNFFVGSASTPVTAAGSISATVPNLTNGLLGNDTSVLTIGNDTFWMSQGQSRTFDGLFDNLRIYGSTANNTGALSLEQLETLRSADAIPEPSAFAAFAGVAALGFAASRRRRRA